MSSTSTLPKRRLALVIEDDPNIQMIHSTFLKNKNIDAVVCGNGKKALEIYRAQAFDLVIVDYLLPGMDGLKFVEHARQHAKVPMIVCSALLKDPNIVQRLRGLGVTTILNKPFRLPELERAVNEALGRN